MLHYAANKLALDIVELLLMLGADVHATDGYVSSLSQQHHQHWQALPSVFMTFRLLVYAKHQILTSHTLKVAWATHLGPLHHTICGVALHVCRVL